MLAWHLQKISWNHVTKCHVSGGTCHTENVYSYVPMTSLMPQQRYKQPYEDLKKKKCTRKASKGKQIGGQRRVEVGVRAYDEKCPTVSHKSRSNRWIANLWAIEPRTSISTSKKWQICGELRHFSPFSVLNLIQVLNLREIRYKVLFSFLIKASWFVSWSLISEKCKPAGRPEPWESVWLVPKSNFRS